jgi:hypothetical protein
VELSVAVALFDLNGYVGRTEAFARLNCFDSVIIFNRNYSLLRVDHKNELEDSRSHTGINCATHTELVI